MFIITEGSRNGSLFMDKCISLVVLYGHSFVSIAAAMYNIKLTTCCVCVCAVNL